MKLEKDIESISILQILTILQRSNSIHMYFLITLSENNFLLPEFSLVRNKGRNKLEIVPVSLASSSLGER